MNAVTTRVPNENNIVIPLITAVLLTFFLAFIDEDYYSFAWMKDPGSWIAVLIYVGIMFVVQMVVQVILFRFYHGPAKGLLVALIGVTLAFVLLFGVVF